jgi:hypothetical protein
MTTAQLLPLIASFATGIIVSFLGTFMLIRWNDRDGGKE